MKKQKTTINRFKKLAGLKPLYESRKKQQLNEFWEAILGAAAWWLVKRLYNYFEGDPGMVSPGTSGGGDLPFGMAEFEAEALMNWAESGGRPSDEIAMIVRKYQHFTPYGKRMGKDDSFDRHLGEALDYDDLPPSKKLLNEKLWDDKLVFNPWDDGEKDPFDNPFGGFDPWNTGSTTGGDEGSGDGSCKAGCGNLCSVATNAKELETYVSRLGSEKEIENFVKTTIEPIGTGFTWDWVVRKAGMREEKMVLKEWLGVLIGLIALGVGTWALFRKPNCDCPCGGMVRPGGDGSLPATRKNEIKRPSGKRKSYYKKHRMSEQTSLLDDNPCDSWGNFQTWSDQFEQNFTNAPWANNPNQPCKFLGNRVDKWRAKAQGGIGQAWQAQLNCKIQHTIQTLGPQYGCTNLTESKGKLSKVKKAILNLMKESTNKKLRQIANKAGIYERLDEKKKKSKMEKIVKGILKIIGWPKSGITTSTTLGDLISRKAEFEKMAKGSGGDSSGDSGPKEPKGEPVDESKGQLNEAWWMGIAIKLILFLLDEMDVLGLTNDNTVGDLLDKLESDDVDTGKAIGQSMNCCTGDVHCGAGGRCGKDCRCEYGAPGNPWDNVGDSGDSGPKEPKGQDMAESRVPRRLLEAVKAVRRSNSKGGCGCSKK